MEILWNLLWWTTLIDRRKEVYTSNKVDYRVRAETGEIAEGESTGEGGCAPSFTHWNLSLYEE